MILTESKTRQIAERTLAKVRADSATVTVESSEERNIRFARNGATTNGERIQAEVGVTVNIGKRSGSYRTSQIDDAGLQTAVEQATAIARLAPENAEFMPPLGAQHYPAGVDYDPASANPSAALYASKLEPIVTQARAQNVATAGFLAGGPSALSIATSSGLFAYHRRTDFDFTVTARTPDGTGSGWQGTANINLAHIDAPAMGHAAIDKAVRSRQAQPIEPGKYTVVLEPSPAADLIGFLQGALDARAADEGRSAFSKRGGGNRIGEHIVSDKVTLRSDPGSTLAPSGVAGDDGMPQAPVNWIENGVLSELTCSRYWAQHSNRTPRSHGDNLILNGGTKSIDELVRGVDRGILITRFWYIRFVDQRSLLLTGLTRDGLFLIEHGEITRPVKNMRWNESPLAVLSNVVELGKTVRARGTEQSGSIAAPPILAHDFTFSSLSDAV